MKKIFDIPELKITKFMEENITTVSGLTGTNIGAAPGEGYTVEEKKFEAFTEMVDFVS